MALYAVVSTGGKQYRVAEGDVLEVERLDGQKGAELTLDRVLMVQELAETVIGNPTVPDARVVVRIMDQCRGRKIRGFKYKCKSGYKRTFGHRQELTRVRVVRIGRGA